MMVRSAMHRAGAAGLSALLAGLKRFVDPPSKDAGTSRDSVYFADLAAMVTANSGVSFSDDARKNGPSDCVSTRCSSGA